ncbi:protein arginine N-methyltransferase 9 isoform X2 [Nilaparvata lugens]|uniref:protein arginine N-methyltransferase 9 isoform X2 n=1 Tax=Nilaparvata lugens TaxID=108931 RepID=UPI00193E8B79|nr:protein arginine N-methyltransferase 9 isoform X2 [Nilaparvata lugens]
MARVELENDSSQEPAPECSTVCSPTDDDSSQQHFLIPGYNLIFIKEEEYGEWGEVLADQKKFKDLFRGYDLALQVYPDNRFVINHLGEFHYRAGDFAKAHFYFKKACSMSPTECVESERNLEMCKSAMVDRWHFRMLNDSHRNEAYREAITKKIKQGFCRVLDIGTGSGLLSLIASELCYETSGAGPVFACEENFTMIKIAKNIQRRNLFVTMKLFHSHSRKLFLEHLHDKRVSLVVTEIMDAGLFGEGVLQTLNDAWRRFLLPPLPTQECSSCCDEEKPGVCMICNDQKLSPELRLSPRVNGMVVPLGATVWLAAIESVHVARQHRSLSSILRHNIETPFIFVNNSHEPYDSENLQSFPDAFKLLCEPIKCFFVNFNDPDQLLSFYNGQFDHHLHKIQFTTEGSLDAFVVWFDLHVDEDIKISTSPFDENAATCCWDQAIFPVHSELRVVAGSSAQLKVQTIKGILIVKLWEIENHIPSKSNYEEIPVSQEFIKFFNNSEYLDHLAIYSRTMACPGATILDLCPFPLVGLMRLKEDEDSSLYFIAKCKDDKLAVERIVEVNDIDPSRIVFGEECDVNDDDFMMRSKYDVVVTNLISQEGEMSPSSIYHLSSCKNFLSDYGRIIPQGVTVWGQLISSKP